MTHMYRRLPRYDGDDWLDDCPPPYHGRVIVTHPPAKARLTLPSSPPLPPCTPRGGINTDWSGNKCAILHEGPSQPLAAQPAPLAQRAPPGPKADPGIVAQEVPPIDRPPEPKADPGTVAQEVPPIDNHAHFSLSVADWGFGVGVVLAVVLALAIVVLFATRKQRFEGDAP